MDEYTNYLAHHGVKGQKWGVRRYQNADGSLTLAGRARYGVKSKGKSPDEVRSMISADLDKKRKKARARLERKKSKMNSKLAKQDKKLKAKAEEQERKEKAKREYDEWNKSRKESYAKELDKERAAKEEAYQKGRHEKMMETMAGASKEAVKSDIKELQEMTARYKAAADYLDARDRVEKYVDRYSEKPVPKKTKLEKAVDIATKAEDFANKAKKVYDVYNTILGNKQTKSKSTTSAFSLLSDAEKNKAEMNMNKARDLVRGMSDIDLNEAIKRTENEQKLVNAILGKDEKIYKKK